METLKYLGLIFLLLFEIKGAEAQPPTNGRVLQATIDAKGDTLPFVFLNEIAISSTRLFKSAADQRRYDKLYRNVVKVYPYAKNAGIMFNNMANDLTGLESKKEKKEFTKKLEEELKAKYGNELKELTVSQGRLLIKLIDRETSLTSYEILKEYRGNVSAFFWQGLASMFGSSLKTGYDPQEDRDIEIIIQSIEGSGKMAGSR